MIGPIKAKAASTALVLRESITNFHRGRHATSFLSAGLGMVIAPSNAVSNLREARELVKTVEENGVSRGRVYQVDSDQLALMAVGKDKRSMLFMVADATKIDAQSYVLPESIKPTFFRQVGAGPREYFYDSIEVNRETAGLVKDIEIEDQLAAGFIREKLKGEVKENGSAYLLIYHNYRDEETKKIQLKADAIVYIKKFKAGPLKDDITGFFVQRLPGSALRRLPLEILVEDYPLRAIASRDDIKISRKQYEGIYKATPLKGSALPAALSELEWPFPTNVNNLAELKKPALTLKEKWGVYKKALMEDPIFAMACVGSLLQSVGKGLMEGFLLPAIMLLGQDVLKVAAAAAIVIKFSSAFHLWGNSKGASDVEQLEAKERLRGELDKQFPLWDTGARYKSTQDLIRKYTTGSLHYLFAGGLFFLLTPPIFAPLMALIGPAAAVAFITLYVAHEFINARTDGLVFNNLLKIIENRIRFNPKYKKNYWTVRAFHENLEIAVNQGALAVGVGAATLFRFLAPSSLGAASIVVGIVSLGLYACRLMLRLFGKDEKTRLDIGETDFLRYGKSLKISENIHIQLGEDVKVAIIEQEKKHRIVIPDYEKHGIKLKVSNLKNITVKKNWLSKLLPFDFARRQSVIVKTNDPSDPEVIFKLYGKAELTPQQIEERFIIK